MKIKLSKGQITFTGIQNESQLESVTSIAPVTSCKVKQLDNGCKAIVTGTLDQLLAYVRIYNADEPKKEELIMLKKIFLGIK